MTDSPSTPPKRDVATLQATDGTKTVAEIVEAHAGVPMIALGKETIFDIGKRLAQISGLKPGRSSIRTPEMIDEILERLANGQTLTTITSDPHMPAHSTFWYWCDADADLASKVKAAQAVGQRVLADARLDIAAGGLFSTGDARRDEMLVKAINANIAQRNRSEFGEKVQVDQRQVIVNITKDDADW